MTKETEKRRPQSKSKGKQRKNNNVHQRNSVNQRNSNSTDALNRTRHHVKNLLWNDQAAIIRRRDGSFHIIPPSRQQVPNEILTTILHHLSKQKLSLYQCSLVNKQFHHVANPFVWQVLHLRDDDDRTKLLCAYLSKATFNRLKQLGQHIREVRILGNGFLDGQFLRLVPHLTFLDHLIIGRDSGFSDASFKHLPKSCCRLTSLKLECPRLTRVSFSAIGQHCHQLNDFQWTIDNNQSQATMLTLLKDCPLDRLQIYAKNLARLDEQSMTAIKSFHHLTHLQINRLPSYYHTGQVHYNPAPWTFLLQPTMTARSTTTGLENIPFANHDHTRTATTTHANWPQLKEFKLIGHSDIDDTAMVAFIKAHPRLRHLELSYATHLTDITIDGMAAWLPELASLTITENANISADALRRLICRCHSLVELDIGGCQRALVSEFPELMVLPYHNPQRFVLRQNALDLAREQQPIRQQLQERLERHRQEQQRQRQREQREREAREVRVQIVQQTLQRQEEQARKERRRQEEQERQQRRQQELQELRDKRIQYQEQQQKKQRRQTWVKIITIGFGILGVVAGNYRYALVSG